MQLRDYLHVHRVRQVDFARKIDCSEAHLSNLVNGQARPSLALALAIAHATGNQVSPSDWPPVREEQE